MKKSTYTFYKNFYIQCLIVVWALVIFGLYFTFERIDVVQQCKQDNGKIIVLINYDLECVKESNKKQ